MIICGWFLSFKFVNHCVLVVSSNVYEFEQIEEKVKREEIFSDSSHHLESFNF